MKNTDFQVLISCMYQDNTNQLVKKSNLRGQKVLIVNQVDTDEDKIIHHNKDFIEINTPTRGLSISRNIALEHSSAKICLLSDDDEVFIDNISEKIITAYNSIPDADIIIFSMKNRDKTHGERIRKLKLWDTLKVSSWQISFKLESIKKKNILFDPILGAGTDNGAGEENKFLLDCYRNKLKIYYVPTDIATVAQNQSTWFHGYDKNYFYNRGKTTRYIYGLPFSSIYALYFLLSKRKLYAKQISMRSAMKNIYKGIIKNDLNNLPVKKSKNKEESK